MAIGISTVLLFLSYLMFIFGFATVSDGETTFGGGLLGIAGGLVPAVFLCVAAISQHERTIRAVLLASSLWIVFGLPLAILDIPSGLVAGFGAGAVVALRREPVHTTTSRAIAVAICVVYVFVLGRIIPEAALMVGAVLPIAAIGVADSIVERELSDSTVDADEPTGSTT